MRASKSGSWSFKRKHVPFDGGTCKPNMKQLPFMGVVCTVMLFIVYRTTNYQYEQTEMDSKLFRLYTSNESGIINRSLLPRGIMDYHADYKLKPLWSTSSSKSKADITSEQNLLALPVGIKQKHNVDAIVRKVQYLNDFLPENFTIILFHYDGNVDGWWDIEWSKDAIHVVALNQTKWWFAKRFLHPSVVNIYSYIFLWDEDLGVENFDPGRYLDIVRSEGLEISQPALDRDSTGIHHRITVRRRKIRFHRRVYVNKRSFRCSASSDGPPCSGFVEGMAPVFSRGAWRCVWNLIQNDLVHGWGMDMKLGYCAQGHRSEKVGVVDTEYIVHQGTQTLGGQSGQDSDSKETVKTRVIDVRSEIRRQSSNELQIFEDRWEKAVKEDGDWVDPYRNSGKPKRRRIRTRKKIQRVS